MNKSWMEQVWGRANPVSWQWDIRKGLFNVFSPVGGSKEANIARARLGARGPGGPATDVTAGATRAAGGPPGTRYARLGTALDKMHGTRIKFGTGMMAAGGVLEGLMDPDKNPLWTGIVRGAEGFVWETFFPGIGVAIGVASLASIPLSVPGQMSAARAQRLNYLASGRGLYSQVDPTQNQFSGNIRRQSLGYILSSRQNTKSFVGSEASYLHQTS